MKNNLQKHINQDLRKDIDALFSHADIANREMSDIKTNLAVLKEDVKNLKDNVSLAVRQNWAILLIIVTAAITIIFKTK